jgi:hypothetical protein
MVSKFFMNSLNGRLSHIHFGSLVNGSINSVGNQCSRRTTVRAIQGWRNIGGDIDTDQ